MKKNLYKFQSRLASQSILYRSIPTFLGILFLISALATGVLIIKNNQLEKLYAAQISSPKNVRVTNITHDQLTITWTTQIKTSGYVKWGNSEHSLANIVTSTNDSFTHSATITSLEPSQEYFFTINSDGVDFDNNKIPWQTRTGPQLTFIRDTHTISGQVLDQLGRPVKNALVYALVSGGSPLSTMTSEVGSFVINISKARTLDLNSPVTISLESTVVELLVFADQESGFSYKYYLSDKDPLPPLIVGGDSKKYNYHDKDLPQAELPLPDTINSGGFGELLDQ